MARLHPQQANGGSVVVKTSSGGGLHAQAQFDQMMAANKMNRSQFDNNGPEDPLMFNEMPQIGGKKGGIP